MKFEWDENKNNINQLKHGIEFEYAKKVFYDANRITSPDLRFDYGEDRWITIGKVMDTLLTVAFTIRNTNFRIISARYARNKEYKMYNKSNYGKQ